MPFCAAMRRPTLLLKNSERAPVLFTEPASSWFVRYETTVFFGVPLTSMAARAAQ